MASTSTSRAPGRGRRLAMFVAAIGLVVLGGAAIALEGPLRQWWWTRQLARGNFEERRVAAVSLGRAGVARVLIERLARDAPGVFVAPAGIWEELRLDDGGLSTFKTRRRAAAIHAGIDELGPDAVPALVAALEDDDEFVRLAALQALALMGDRATGAAAALRRLRRSPGGLDIRAVNATLDSVLGHEEFR